MVEIGVEAAASDQLLVRAGRDDLPLVEHDDAVDAKERRAAVRREQDRGALLRMEQGLEDFLLGAGIDVRERVVETSRTEHAADCDDECDCGIPADFDYIAEYALVTVPLDGVWTYDAHLHIWTGHFAGQPLGCVYASVSDAAVWHAGYSGEPFVNDNKCVGFPDADAAKTATEAYAVSRGWVRPTNSETDR